MRLAYASFITLLALAAPFAANAKGFSLGLSAGSLGVGVDAVYGISPRINLHANLRAYDYGTDIEGDSSNELTYRGDLELGNAGIGIDIHPWVGAFRISLGFQNSDNKISASAVCEQSNCEFGNNQNALGSGDRADLLIDLSGNHAYAGFGWGNAVSDGSALGLFFDLGVMFQGKPKITVTAKCSDRAPGVNEQQECDNQAENEEKELQEEADKFELFPIVNLGLRWRFN